MLFKFRNPKESDIQELIVLAKEHGFDEEDILLPIKYSKENCFIIEAEGKIVGANLYIKIDKGLAYSSLWFIDSDYEKMALEGELEESASIDLKKLGIKTLITTINKENENMINIFTKLGWTKIGEIKNKILVHKELE